MKSELKNQNAEKRRRKKKIESRKRWRNVCIYAT